MRLNHLNLCVDDLTAARALFQNCFDFQFLEQKGEAIIVLSDGHGFTLVLSSLEAFGSELQHYPKGFHVGFILETPAHVDQAYRLLAEAAVQFAHAPRKIRGSYTFYFTALNDILFEVSSPATKDDSWQQN